MKCGDIYRRVAWNNRGKKSIVWRCCTRVENGPSGCTAPTVPEEELQQAVIDAMNAVLESSKDVIAILEENILEVISQDNSDEIEEINKTIAEKQKKLLELVHSKKDYSKCADEMEKLRQNKQLLLVKHAQTEGTRQRINELVAYVKTQDTQITEYDDKLVRKYIDQIKIYADKFVVCFKAKMEINVLR
jgi:site-specific DNA recombinase